MAAENKVTAALRVREKVFEKLRKLKEQFGKAEQDLAEAVLRLDEAGKKAAIVRLMRDWKENAEEQDSGNAWAGGERIKLFANIGCPARAGWKAYDCFSLAQERAESPRQREEGRHSGQEKTQAVSVIAHLFQRGASSGEGEEDESGDGKKEGEDAELMALTRNPVPEGLKGEETQKLKGERGIAGEIIGLIKVEREDRQRVDGYFGIDGGRETPGMLRRSVVRLTTMDGSNIDAWHALQKRVGQ